MSEKNKIVMKLKDVQSQAEQEIKKVVTIDDLKALQIKFMGTGSPIDIAFKEIGQLPKEERPSTGQYANQVKQIVDNTFAKCIEEIKTTTLQRVLIEERLDITLPGYRPAIGRLHPATQALRQVCRIFSDMGFQIFRSTETDTDYYNFEMLNMPAHHPARDKWDTFYTTNPKVLLRTHTSPGQIHAMRKYVPEPIRVILPGMCYRYEQISASHEFQFNQLELLVVGHNITFGDLKGTLEDFARRMFGENVRTRFRPGYFPFTEPSAEMDIECFVCGGSGCQVCKGAGWLEILGSGMVHPVVLQNGGYDPLEYSGYAAGLGTERICMLQRRIEDIRYFWQNDIRFLEQF